MNMTKCPVCRGMDIKRWGVKNKYPIFQCRGCSHIFAGEVPLSSTILDSEEFRRHITNGEMQDDLSQFRHLCKGEVEGGHVFLTSRLILEDVAAQPSMGREWLDIGCGSGYLVSQVQRRGIKATGIEPGGWGQIAARERNIKVVQGLLQADTFAQKFDYVSATDVLEHQSDPYILVNLIRHYLAPSGRAYLSFPLAGTLRPNLLKARWGMVFPPTHCSFFTRKSFSQLAKNVGMKVEKITQYNSMAIIGWGRLGLSLSTANKIGDLIKAGDQGLFVLSHGSPG